MTRQNPATRQPSRRGVLTASGAALAAGVCGAGVAKGNGLTGETETAAGTSEQGAAPLAAGALGINFNEDPSDLRLSHMEALSARWMRGFVPIRASDQGDPAEQPAVATLLAASRQGYRTVLSLKFPYQDQPLPAPGSDAMAALLTRVDAVLRAVMGKVDMLTIGNEPFLETLPGERDSTLNAFYERLAAHVVAHRAERCGEDCRTRLYMGALNRLDDPAHRTPATERWMAHVRDTPAIDGVDIHPHVGRLESTGAFLDYVLPRLRTDQTFLATEFSLVDHWARHRADTVPTEFATRYGVPRDTQVWQVIAEAIRHPFPQRKWNDFLALSRWFESRRTYLTNQTRMFRDTGRLAVATYAGLQIRSMAVGYGPDKTPWILNPVYANRTVRQDADGTPGRNYAWFEAFRALQPA
ncbi:hypothetical protein IM697_38445 [Streptomyces ferrugineus]|uniref:Uncharacterized protein n=1 Tax=Streptomyces ferrugineus TaxID=1413221 RepID=A0A7M2SK75_9ACTN|nr:hypothetical protein [Streptomyces ferrugineus]QOV35863.1 hypothetical protein IM697_38445 [Streptomyces ferrugineus]